LARGASRACGAFSASSPELVVFVAKLVDTGTMRRHNADRGAGDLTDHRPAKPDRFGLSILDA